MRAEVTSVRMTCSVRQTWPPSLEYWSVRLLAAATLARCARRL